MDNIEKKLLGILVAAFLVAAGIWTLVFLQLREESADLPAGDSVTAEFTDEEMVESEIVDEGVLTNSNAEDTVLTEDTVESVKRLVVHSPAGIVAFPSGVATSYDALDDTTSGAFLATGNVSFVGRDQYILQQINAVIDSEVDPDSSAIVFPSSLRLSTDHDGVVNVDSWQCGGAYTSDRDSYILYALTEVKRGHNPASDGRFGFSGLLVAESDSSGSYTTGQCFDESHVTLEGRDRYLLDMVNQLSIVEEVVE